MARHLPFLNGLRAFEAAARRGSFTSAAAELHVTQAAVSQQVQLLEERLGFALFRRHANRLELTDQGRAFQPGLTDAFDAIAKLIEQVAAMRLGSVLTVGVAPAFALHWLIPRLPRFNRGHPQIEVHVAAGGAMLPLRDDWTCTVRRGIGGWPGYTAEELFPTTLVPVCSPAIGAGFRDPRDLQGATLIVVSHLREQWTWWFEAAGLSAPIMPAGEVVFENSAMAMQAVLEGVGVAIAQLPYVRDEVVEPARCQDRDERLLACAGSSPAKMLAESATPDVQAPSPPAASMKDRSANPRRRRPSGTRPASATNSPISMPIATGPGPCS